MSVALIAGAVAIVGGVGAGLRILARISARLGQLIERFDGHIKVSDEMAADHEQRIRGLESRRRRR